MALKPTEPGYRDHTFYRADFKSYGPGEDDNFFDDLLGTLNIRERDKEQVNYLDVRISHCEATG